MKINVKSNSCTLWLCLILTFGLIQGCGFQLRGDYLLSPQLQNIYVSSVDKHGELTRLVKQHLLFNKINITPQLTQQTPELRILNDTLDRRTLSVFSNGQVAEYELIYSAKYQLIFEDQEVRDYEIELNRDYQDDPNLALAKSRELTLMLSEMRQEAADKILRNLSSLKL
ncbi:MULTISPECIES: LPS assembly lipoprotein LptE [Colwelliaceae]|uniref:LPS-assembly lipoprotein LptE n=1 Tax=Colwelliaceae TaxID=267889 RepID=UPI001FE27FC1|nr:MULTISPECIES: LPS assembly lipoprotein LptE [Colwelliaceae]